MNRQSTIVSLIAMLMMLCLPAMAQQKGKPISMTVTKTSLPKALNSVEQQSGYYKINYSYDELSSYKVTATIRNQTAIDAVRTLLNGLPYTATINGKYIQIKRSKQQPARQQSATPQKKSVSGRITDAGGEPLMGVTVMVPGTQKGTVTDINGRYVIADADPNDDIEISYVGKKTIRRKAGSKSLNIILDDDNNLLNDIVVTGYQTLSRERSAGSYGIIKGSDVSEKVSLTGDIVSSLEGLTTGLDVNNSAGADKFIVRGITSINSNRAPLIVVDGVPLEQSMVEELLVGNDIENVTLLKDATAASIWGSQAANGVIVITTKKGHVNERTRVSYEGSYTYYGKPDYSYQHMMDGATFMKNAQEVFDMYSQIMPYDDAKLQTYLSSSQYTYTDNPVIFPHERLMYQYQANEITQAERDAGLNALIAQDGRKSYEDNFMSNKMMTRHNVTVTGGSDKQTYFLSVGYIGNQGTEKDWTDRYTINAKQDFQFTKWLKWDITINASLGKDHAHGSAFKAYGDSHWISNYAYYRDFPYAVFTDAAGNQLDWSDYSISSEIRQKIEDGTGMDMSFYPIQDFNRATNKTKSTNLRINTGLTINLFKGLRYEGRLQYSRFHSKQEQYWPQQNYLVREEIAAMTSTTDNSCVLPKTGGRFLLDNGITSDWTVRNQLQYDNEFDNGRHQITALAGTEVREYKNTIYETMLRGYDMQTMTYQPYDIYALQDPIMDSYIGGYYHFASSRYYNQSETMLRYFSLYANAAYTYLSRYTLNASMRIDQSNLFGSDPSDQYKPIWSVGAAWKMSEENFMKDFSCLDLLNLRATFGYAGNSPQPGSGGKYDILEATTSSWFENPGYEIITPANKKLTWEKTRTINLGFDAAFLANRLNVSFDYYRKHTTDLLSTQILNPTTGWASVLGNVGNLNNNGIELTINSHNIKGKDFNWHTMLTLSHNSNKITKLSVETPLTASNLTNGAVCVEGYPVNALFSYRYAGLNDEGICQAYDKDGNIVTGSAASTLTKDDVVYSGTTVPKVYGGLTNKLSYKDFDLSFLIVYNFGAKMRDQSGTLTYGRPVGNMYEDFDRRWRKAGDELTTDVPRYTVYYDSENYISLYQQADSRILNASFIKLRDISLTYHLPQAIASKLYMQSASITLQAGNLITWTANSKDIDPEAYYFSSSIYNRQDKFGPSYSVKLNINF